MLISKIISGGQTGVDLGAGACHCKCPTHLSPGGHAPVRALGGCNVGVSFENIKE